MNVPLRQIIKVHYGKALKSEERNGTGEHIVYGSSGPIGKHTQTIVTYPTLIIGRKGSVGTVTYAPQGGWAIDTAFYTELVNSREVDIRYLYYALRDANLERHTITTSIPGLNRDDIYKTTIPLPSFEEQKRIAAILDKADALREKRRQVIAKLNVLLQSVFLGMFGDPVTNPKGWEVGSIDLVVKDKSDVRCGPFGTQLKVHELVGEGIPLFGIENVLNNQFISKVSKFLSPEKAKTLSAFSVRPDDVLVTRMGTIGRACVVPPDVKEGVISYHLFRVRPDQTKCLPQFLAYTICRSGSFQAQLRQLSHGAIMDGLSTGNLKAVKFLLPPLSNQKRYVEYVEKAESAIARHKEGLRKSETLFRSLQQRAFKGELFNNGIDELKAIAEAGASVKL